MSITGVRTGSPSISVWGARSGTPPEISETSVLVPPMSRVMMSWKPDRPARPRAPTTPAAGPENRAEMAFFDMASTGRRPPLDCMMENRPAKPRSLRVFGKPVEISLDDRLDEGGKRGGRGALILAELPRDVAGTGHRHVGRVAPHGLRHPALVIGIGVTVKQADRHRIEVADAEEPGHLRIEALVVERVDHGAVGRHPLVDFADILPADDRFGLAVVQIVDRPAVVALQGEEVARAPGDEHADPPALALQHRICRDRRAVHQVGHALEVDPGGIDGVDGAAVRGVRRARHLGDAGDAVPDLDQIGKRAPDFDAHAHDVPPATGTLRHGTWHRTRIQNRCGM